MDKLKIFQLVTKMHKAFIEQRYSADSVRKIHRTLMEIHELHISHDCDFYSQPLIAEFVTDVNKRFDNGLISKTHYRFLLKTASYLEEYNETGEIRFGRKAVKSVSKYYDGLLAEIRSCNDWTPKSQHHRREIARTFFSWLKSKGHDTLEKLDETTVKEYLVDCALRLSGSSIDTVSRALKAILVFLYDSGYIKNRFDKLFSFTFPYERRVKFAVPQSEIAATLNVINRSTATGKRDYASILLAVVTGLRAGDVALLKLKDIDWANGEVKILQSKTGKSLALPLTFDVGLAVRDYILNGRPQSEYDNVFLSAKAPIRAMTTSSLRGQYNVHRATAGLSSSPFHALRRAVGTNMVTSDIPVTTVAQVLGHSDIDSTKKYIALNTKHLKDCSLDFVGIEPNSTIKKAVQSND